MARNDTERTTDPMESRYRAPALDRGLDILEVLATKAGGLTRAEISHALGISASQSYRVLERLVARGYVCRVEGGDRYALTMRLFLLATDHPPMRRLVAQAQPLMDDFARELQQSCHLVVREGNKGVVVAQASPAVHWEFRARVGAQMELASTGSGLILLAFRPPGRPLAEDLPRGREDELSGIRADGHRMASSGQVFGVTDISVPVFGPSGEAVAALTCAVLGGPEGAARQPLDRILFRLKSIATTFSTPGPA